MMRYLEEARKTETLDTTNCHKAVYLVHTAFWEYQLV